MMITGLFQSALMLALVAVFYVGDVFFMARFDRDRNEGDTGRDLPYTIFATIVVIVVLGHPVFIEQLNITFLMLRVPIWVQVIGAVIGGLSIALNWWSRLHLKHYYSEGAVLLEDHQVIDTGPYAYVRHPFFVSLFLLTGGLLLITPSIIMLFVFIMTIIDFTGAAKRDEQLLLDELTGYDEYMERTGRFFPKLK